MSTHVCYGAILCATLARAARGGEMNVWHTEARRDAETRSAEGAERRAAE